MDAVVFLREERDEQNGAPEKDFAYKILLIRLFFIVFLFIIYKTIIFAVIKFYRWLKSPHSTIGTLTFTLTATILIVQGGAIWTKSKSENLLPNAEKRKT